MKNRIINLALAALILGLAMGGTALAHPALELARSLVAAANVAAEINYQHADVVQVNALAGLGRTTSWCETVTSGATEDLWASANVPAELTSGVRSSLRWLVVMHVGNGTTSAADDVAACVRLGPDTDSPVLSCDVATPDVNGMLLLSKGSARPLEIRPPPPGQTTAAEASVPLWATSSGANLNLCVDVGW